MFLFDDPLCPGECLGPLLFGRLIRVDFVFLEKLTRHEIRIAAQKDVCAAACHVGSDRDRALAARLGDDFRFTFVILRVQNVVGNGLALQSAGDEFRVFHRYCAYQRWLASFVTILYLFNYCIPFLGQGAIDHV